MQTLVLKWELRVDSFDPTLLTMETSATLQILIQQQSEQDQHWAPLIISSGSKYLKFKLLIQCIVWMNVIWWNIASVTAFIQQIWSANTNNSLIITPLTHTCSWSSHLWIIHNNLWMMSICLASHDYLIFHLTTKQCDFLSCLQSKYFSWSWFQSLFDPLTPWWR